MANHPQMALGFPHCSNWSRVPSFADMDIISQSDSHQKIFAMLKWWFSSTTHTFPNRFQSNYLIPPEKKKLVFRQFLYSFTVQHQHIHWIMSYLSMSMQSMHRKPTSNPLPKNKPDECYSIHLIKHLQQKKSDTRYLRTEVNCRLKSLQKLFNFVKHRLFPSSHGTLFFVALLAPNGERVCTMLNCTMLYLSKEKNGQPTAARAAAVSSYKGQKKLWWYP